MRKPTKVANAPPPLKSPGVLRRPERRVLSEAVHPELPELAGALQGVGALPIFKGFLMAELLCSADEGRLCQLLDSVELAPGEAPPQEK